MPSIRFKCEIPPEQIKRLESLLDPKEMKSAMYQAISRTAGTVKTIVVDNIRSHSAMSAKYARRGVSTVIPSKGETPEAFIVVSGKPVPLIGFRATFSKSKGATVIVGEGKPPIKLAHAFKATVTATRSDGSEVDHDGIFTRGMSKTVASHHRRLNKKGHAIVGGVAAGYAGRLPIVQLYGPSAASIAHEDEVQKAIEPQINDVLIKNIDSQIDRFLQEKAKQ
jgi:hypothetical protein